MRAVGLPIALIFLLAAAGVAQIPGTLPGAAGDAGAGPGAGGVGDRLAIAISSPNYPVTPGDTYELTFTAGGELTTSVVTVQSDYRLNLNIFGEFDTRGMTYTELRREVEDTVLEAYPQSLPSFRLVSVGLFEVTIRGAIEETTRVTAWGLSRLSSLVQPLFEPYSSRRQVIISSRIGRSRSYDLFRATNFGVPEEDPYIEPGDSVRVLPIGSVVSVRGEVNRPGRYEILSGNTLSDAIRFAGGFTPEAEEDRVQLVRGRAGTNPTEFHDLSKEGSVGPVLADGDRITVETELLGQPLLFFEGAVAAGQAPDGAVPGAGGAQAAAAGEAAAAAAAGGAAAGGAAGGEGQYQRFSVRYQDGLMLSDVLLQYQDRIAPLADLSSAAVIRAGSEEVLPVEAGKLLYGYGDAGDVELRPYDTVFIPSRQTAVLVTGPVAAPGLYLYVPGKPPEYYIRRAGGFNREISTTGEYVVLDAAGNERAGSDHIQPGDQIEVERNNFVYQFNRHFPVIVSSLSLVTTVISLFAVINQ